MLLRRGQKLSLIHILKGKKDKGKDNNGSETVQEDEESVRIEVEGE